MGKRPGRGVGEVVPELGIAPYKQNDFSTKTREYILNYAKTSKHDLDAYLPGAFESAASAWLETYGDIFFSVGEAKYRWPEQADKLTQPIADMMLRQWSYRKNRNAEKAADWQSTTDSEGDEEYENDNHRKRPRPFDEMDYDTVEAQRPKVPRFVHANDNSYTASTSIPPPPMPTARSVPVSPSMNYQAVVPNRSAAQKAAVSITKMAQHPFQSSQEDVKENTIHLARNDVQPAVPTSTCLRFATGSRTVDMTPIAASGLVQSMIEQIEDIVTHHQMQSMEVEMSDQEINCHMQASERLTRMLFDLERRARRASTAKDIKQG